MAFLLLKTIYNHFESILFSIFLFVLLYLGNHHIQIEIHNMGKFHLNRFHSHYTADQITHYIGIPDKYNSYVLSPFLENVLLR